MNYPKFCEKYTRIITKENQDVPFVLNTIQNRYITQDATGRDLIVKARQQGFSSVLLAQFTADFLLLPNTRNVIVADIDENATELLDRVKHYIKAYEEITGVKVPLKYNSRAELFNESMGSRYTIGTAKNTEFGRSKTITNLHLSEAAFYPDLEKILAGAGTAVVENGRFIIETTANGFNYLKEFWDNSVLSLTGFNPLFYKASDFYSPEFLAKERLRLGRLFPQEYPGTAEDAFLTSGESFFDLIALKETMEKTRPPMTQDMIYL